MPEEIGRKTEIESPPRTIAHADARRHAREWHGGLSKDAVTKASGASKPDQIARRQATQPAVYGIAYR
jgi:hypothetical protein